MGEYARYNGQQIKIGTCESMYYLRHEQRHLVTPERGSVDPVTDATAIRFRFPFPDEDGLEPGANQYHANGFNRAIPIPGFTLRPELAASFDHGSVQFTARPGYNLSIPCPEGPGYSDEHGSRLTSLGPNGLRVHRNGFNGGIKLHAQKQLADGRVVPIIVCGACEAMARIEDRHDIEAIAVAFRVAGAHDIARRILEPAGILPDPEPQPEPVEHIPEPVDEPTPPKVTPAGPVKFMKHYVTNGAHKARVWYSLDHRTDHRPCVTLYAKDYNRTLGAIFSSTFAATVLDGVYQNDTDYSSDYFDKGRVVLYHTHPLYAAARARAERNAQPTQAAA